MNIQEGRNQKPLAEALPRMNVQYEIQKGLSQNETNVAAVGNANKQILAVAANAQPAQTPQQTAATQISKGYLDIKI